MEEIKSQVKLPFRRAMQISLRGIRIRFGRSVVTMSGVVLGIAFLMSNLTGQLIKKSIAKEREQRNTVNLMLSRVKGEIGDVADRRISIVALGNMSDSEQLLVRQIVSGKPKEVKGLGINIPGVTTTTAEKLSEGSAVLLVLGNQPASSTPLTALTAGLSQNVVIDSLASRTYAGDVTGIRRELFFGKESDEQMAKQEREATAEKFRTWWIVGISLLVTVFGVANALLMSVTERFREIGTMKCLGARSAFIRTLFLIESSSIGLAGSIIGVFLGALLPLVAYGFVYQFGLVFGTMPYGLLVSAGFGAVFVGTLLSILAAIYPAWFASRMVPASALRSTV